MKYSFKIILKKNLHVYLYIYISYPLHACVDAIKDNRRNTTVNILKTKNIWPIPLVISI